MSISGIAPFYCSVVNLQSLQKTIQQVIYGTKPTRPDCLPVLDISLQNGMPHTFLVAAAQFMWWQLETPPVLGLFLSITVTILWVQNINNCWPQFHYLINKMKLFKMQRDPIQFWQRAKWYTHHERQYSSRQFPYSDLDPTVFIASLFLITKGKKVQISIIWSGDKQMSFFFCPHTGTLPIMIKYSSTDKHKGLFQLKEARCKRLYVL